MGATDMKNQEDLKDFISELNMLISWSNETAMLASTLRTVEVTNANSIVKFGDCDFCGIRTTAEKTRAAAKEGADRAELLYQSIRLEITELVGYIQDNFDIELPVPAGVKVVEFPAWKEDESDER